MTNMVTVVGLLEHLGTFSPDAPIHIEQGVGSGISFIHGVCESPTAPGTIALQASPAPLGSAQANSIATVADLIQRLQTLSQVFGPNAPIHIEGETGSGISFIHAVGESAYTPGTIAVVSL